MTDARIDRPDVAPDWQDTHSGPVRSDLLTARDVYNAALGSAPRWAVVALALRNRAVALCGLHTPEMGDGMANLPVLVETADRLEVGLTDKHLTFTIETKKGPNRTDVTTRIWFNHWAGRVYLAIVLIPHKLILRQALRRVA